MKASFHNQDALRLLRSAGFGITIVILYCSTATSANRIGATQVIALTGHPSPDGNGAFSQITSPPFLNDNTSVVFGSQLSGTAQGSSDNSGMFRWSAGQTFAVVREGDSLPGGNRQFISPGNNPNLNHNNAVTFFNNSLNPGVGGTGLYKVQGGTTTLL